jgi:Flp pilus assembly protein TadD
MNPNLQRGRVLMDQGRHELAVAEFRQALAQLPDDSDVHANLALALMRVDRWQEAVDSATTAVEKDPDNPLAYWAVAIVALERNLLKEAEDAVRVLIQIDPDMAIGHGLLARVLLERRRPKEALEAADAGLALDPKDDMSLTFRARALMELGREDEAKSVAATLLNDDPDDPWNHCLRGDQLLAEGKADEARAHYLEALRLDPGNDVARFGFATALKSRSPLYAALLKLLQFAGRLRGGAMWVVALVVVFGFRAGDAWAAKHPAAMVPYEIVKGVFWICAGLLMVANPMFDVLLRFDKEGRRALSEDELKATNWYLACFAMAGLCVLWAIKANSTGAPRSLAIGFLMLTLVVSETYEATPGFVRRWMAVIARIAVGSMVLSPVFAVIGVVRRMAGGTKGEMLVYLQISIFLPLVAVLTAMFASDIREWLEKRRPDRG